MTKACPIPLRLEIDDLDVSDWSPHWKTAYRVVRMYQEQALTMSRVAQEEYINLAKNRRIFELTPSVLENPDEHPIYQSLLTWMPTPMTVPAWLLLRALYDEDKVLPVQNALARRGVGTRIRRSSYKQYRRHHVLKARDRGLELRPMHRLARKSALKNDDDVSQAADEGAKDPDGTMSRGEESDVKEESVDHPGPQAKRFAEEDAIPKGSRKKQRPNSPVLSTTTTSRGTPPVSEPVFRPKSPSSGTSGPPDEQPLPDRDPAGTPLDVQYLAQQIKKLEEDVVTLMVQRERQMDEMARQSQLVAHMRQDMWTRVDQLSGQLNTQMTNFEIAMNERAAESKMDVSGQMAHFRSEMLHHMAELSRQAGEQIAAVARHLSLQLGQAKEAMRVIARKKDKERAEAAQHAEAMTKYRMIEHLMGRKPTNH